MSDGREVKIGGQTRTIARFKSYKAALAGEMWGDVAGEVRDLFAEVTKFRREYSAENKLRFTRQMCSERAGQLKVGAEQARKQAEKEENDDIRESLESQAAILEARAASWDRQLEDMGDRDYIEQPREPTTEEELLVAIPIALKTMRTQVVELLALAVMPDADLKRAWRSDEVHKTLSDYGMDLLEELELGEEIELALAVKEVIDDQLRPRMQAIATLRRLWDRQELFSIGSGKDETEPESEQEESEDSTSESPTQSTPSPTPTTGNPSESSSGSPTEQTSPSPVA